MAFLEKSNVPQKYANYANYLIKYARYERSPELIGFYGKSGIGNNKGTFDTPVIKYLSYTVQRIGFG